MDRCFRACAVAMALCACRAPGVTALSDGGGGFGFVVSDAGGPERSGPGGPAGASCAFKAFAAERLPLDLAVLVDASGSMAEVVMATGRSKWQMAQDALSAFAGDPSSAGLGLGLQFFPLVGNGTPCMSAGDCGYTDGAAPGACRQRQVCVTPGQSASGAPACGSPDSPTCGSGTCQPLGTCAVSGKECTNVGVACGGGVPGDLCRFEPFTCASTLAVCAPERYARLAVEIAELPGGAPAIVRMLTMRRPGGVTPMAEGVVGTLNHLRARLGAMPRRRAALILATDGLPSGCSAQDIPIVGDAIWTARMGAPSIPTYVIGVLDAADAADGGSALAELARAGGSGTPFILSPAGDLTAKLQAALAQIRGDALPCEYAIPRDRAGDVDFEKVNVHLQMAGMGEDIPYVARAAQCHATRGGWYYDVDPQGGTPTQVIACPATCARVKADATAKVELRFGCKTVVIE